VLPCDNYAVLNWRLCQWLATFLDGIQIKSLRTVSRHRRPPVGYYHWRPFSKLFQCLMRSALVKRFFFPFLDRPVGNLVLYHTQVKPDFFVMMFECRKHTWQNFESRYLNLERRNPNFQIVRVHYIDQLFSVSWHYNHYCSVAWHMSTNDLLWTQLRNVFHGTFTVVFHKH